MNLEKIEKILAKILRFERLDLQDGASVEGSLERLTEKFADVFQINDPIFDKEKFIIACGGEYDES